MRACRLGGRYDHVARCRRRQSRTQLLLLLLRLPLRLLLLSIRMPSMNQQHGCLAAKRIACATCMYAMQDVKYSKMS